jgi:nicotinamide-nucleotide amidase
MIVETINTGTEILLGNTINSHAAFFGRELFPLGLRLARQVTVPDGPPIREALVESLGRADLVLVTGGLGPTTDDLTREIAAELLGLPLEHSSEIMDEIRARFARRGIPLTDRVGRQAQVPRGAVVLKNRNGTAPGLYLTAEFAGRRRELFLLPGPPRELEPMFREAVLPLLLPLIPPEVKVESRIFRVAGMGESTIEALIGEALLTIEGLELGYCARLGEVEVRCIGRAEVVHRAEQVIRAALSPHIVSDDGRTLEETVVEMLAIRGKKLAVAESCTGGFVTHRITNVPGASRVLIEGFVTYANEAKTRALGVPQALTSTNGAVSRPVAAAMAEGALRMSGADFALATTGIAGPSGGTANRPVGTVFIALAAGAADTVVEHHRFASDRESFKTIVAQTALDLLRRSLLAS